MSAENFTDWKENNFGNELIPLEKRADFSLEGHIKKWGFDNYFDTNVIVFAHNDISLIHIGKFNTFEEAKKEVNDWYKSKS